MTMYDQNDQPSTETIGQLAEQVRTGQLGRRDFLRRAVLLGLSSAAAYKALESQANAQSGDIILGSPGQSEPTAPADQRVTTQAVGEESSPTTKALGEEGQPPSPQPPGPQPPGPSTRAVGEEGNVTTYAVGEESQSTTYAVGEEGQVTTYAVGEENQATTYALGEEGQPATTYRTGEENSFPPSRPSQPTTQALGEESPWWSSPVRPTPPRPFPTYPNYGNSRRPWRTFRRW